MLKTIAMQLPLRLQQTLKRQLHGHRIRNQCFSGDEPEFHRLQEWVKPGDWVLDLGANIGQYTHRLSELVGATGRVIAFEPMPLTFELLSANVARFRHHNVTLINAAASDKAGLVHMDLPSNNFYRASIAPDGAHAVLALTVDELGLGERIAFVKLDVEGHEHAALLGMYRLIRRDRPTLVVEHSGGTAVESLLSGAGYHWSCDADSPNRVYQSRGIRKSANG